MSRIGDRAKLTFKQMMEYSLMSSRSKDMIARYWGGSNIRHFRLLSGVRTSKEMYGDCDW